MLRLCTVLYEQVKVTPGTTTANGMKRDEGREEQCFADFMKRPEAKSANLSDAHV